MKLDIGAAEGPICWDDPEEWVTLDVEGKCFVRDECDYSDRCGSNMTIIADGDHLPFRDKVFELARSSACMFLYTTEKALIEAMRVADEVHAIHISPKGAHFMIDLFEKIMHEWIYTNIEAQEHHIKQFTFKMKRYD